MRRPSLPLLPTPPPSPPLRFRGARAGRGPAPRRPGSAATHGVQPRHRAFRGLGACLLGLPMPRSNQPALGRRRSLWQRLPELLARDRAGGAPTPAQRRLWTTPIGERLPPEPLAPLAFGGHRWWPLRGLLLSEQRVGQYLRQHL